jgi:hypothetical protein
MYFRVRFNPGSGGQLAKYEPNARLGCSIEEFRWCGVAATLDVADFIPGTGSAKKGTWSTSLILRPREPDLNEIGVGF